jgi:hypothetical protein
MTNAIDLSPENFCFLNLWRECGSLEKVLPVATSYACEVVYSTFVTRFILKRYWARH